jgi:hypothetical protein
VESRFAGACLQLSHGQPGISKCHIQNMLSDILGTKSPTCPKIFHRQCRRMSPASRRQAYRDCFEEVHYTHSNLSKFKLKIGGCVKIINLPLRYLQLIFFAKLNYIKSYTSYIKNLNISASKTFMSSFPFEYSV